jgi:hypothetical protein
MCVGPWRKIRGARGGKKVGGGGVGETKKKGSNPFFRGARARARVV